MSKKYAKVKKKNSASSISRYNNDKADQTALKSRLMTNEEYLEQVAKVRKSLPSFDVEKDCPGSSKKKINLKSLFK